MLHQAGSQTSQAPLPKIKNKIKYNKTYSSSAHLTQFGLDLEKRMHLA